jgi:hypothetical protein
MSHTIKHGANGNVISATSAAARRHGAREKSTSAISIEPAYSPLPSIQKHIQAGGSYRKTSGEKQHLSGKPSTGAGRR